MAVTYSPAFAVPSARRGLTSLFGMGRGGAPALSPPWCLPGAVRDCGLTVSVMGQGKGGWKVIPAASPVPGTTGTCVPTDAVWLFAVSSFFVFLFVFVSGIPCLRPLGGRGRRMPVRKGTGY